MTFTLKRLPTDEELQQYNPYENSCHHMIPNMSKITGYRRGAKWFRDVFAQPIIDAKDAEIENLRKQLKLYEKFKYSPDYCSSCDGNVDVLKQIEELERKQNG